jgi:hypothetical protein
MLMKNPIHTAANRAATARSGNGLANFERFFKGAVNDSAHVNRSFNGRKPPHKKRQRASGESALFLIDAMSGTTQEVMASLRGVPSSLKGNLLDAIQAPIQTSLKKTGQGLKKGHFRQDGGDL